MARSVELSEETFARLQALAVPLVDTVEDVIKKLLDNREEKASTSDPLTSGGENNGDDVRQFNPLVPPNLTHTKILAIELDGKPLGRGEANWNRVLYTMIRKAKARAWRAADLNELMGVNIVEGEKTDKGYRFLPDVGLSVQGRDANGAWRAAYHVAQQLGCQLKVKFVWLEEEGAAFPGVIGQFSIAGC
jgi:hypothetical protein